MNAVEQSLLDALRRGDEAAYREQLGAATLLVPVRVDAAGRTTGWVTSARGEHVFLLAYTSLESLFQAAGEQRVPYLTTTLSELAGRWPDPAWWLGVNIGLPIESVLSPEDLRRSTTVRPVAADPGPGAPSGSGHAALPGGVGTPDGAGTLSDAGPPDDTDLPDGIAPPGEAVPPEEAAAAGSGPVTWSGPANDVEEELIDAAQRGDSDRFLKAFLTADVLLPGDNRVRDLADPGYQWPRDEVDGEPAIGVFTSWERMAERHGDVPHLTVPAVAVVRDWPDPGLTLALNPGSPVGASLPGPQVVELAEWAAEVGLVAVMEDARLEEFGTPTSGMRAAAAGESTPDEPGGDLWLQKLLPHQHVGFYLQRGYHLVSGLVHRLGNVGAGVPPARLYRLLGLDTADTPFADTDPHVHALRWPGYGDGSYGDTYPVGEDRTVPQFRIAGAPLPHGALLCRIERGGGETVVATFDADSGQWRAVTEGEAS